MLYIGVYFLILLVTPFSIGTPIPEDKILMQSVSQIYGIGLSQSKILCRRAGFGQDCCGKNVNFSIPKQAGSRVIYFYISGTFFFYTSDNR